MLEKREREVPGKDWDMYSNFEFYAPTKIVFGKGAEENAGKMVKAFGGTRVLIHYGSQSALRSGLIGRVQKSLDAEGLYHVELGGVVPNPHLGKVYEGIELGKKEGIDFILAVGGGSVIDSSKTIALGLANPEDDVWDYYIGKKTTDKSLPIGCILTLAAAGSEMSGGAVITNEKNGLKRDYGSDCMRSKFSLLNPELTMTLPAYQTSCGVADILMHTMERFFNLCDNMEMTDRISVTLMRNVMKYAKVLMKEPDNYKARAEIMWAGTLSHNDLTGCGCAGGDWATHNMEHEMGGMFDVAHGAGLAAIWGSWARYVYKAAPERFVKFALEVMGVMPGDHDEDTIESGIQAMERFYHQIGMPVNMRELGIEPTEEQIAFMAASCEEKAGGANGQVIPLKKEDMEKIYRMAL